MKNRSFVRLWAPLITALVFAIAFLATHFTLNPREKAVATAELNALLDTAEARVAAQKESLKGLDAGADAEAIHKARTMERFLAHDDTLLDTDALIVLCELVGVERAAVLDGEGGVIAASDAGLIGQSYAEDADMAWCMKLLTDGAEPAAQADGADGRMAGAPRTDTDGLVLTWSRSAPLAAIGGGSELRGAVENLAVKPDAIKYVETAGEDGVFEQDGMLYVQRAEGDSTLIAYRPLSEVHAVQNALLTALAIIGALAIVALFIWQFTPDRGGGQPSTADEPADGFDDIALPSESALDSEPEPEPARRPRKRARKKRRPIIEIAEGPEEEAEAPDTAPSPEPAFDPEPEPEPEPAPARKPRKRRSRSAGRTCRPPDDEQDHDAAFDKIFE